ncbi:U3 associated protein Utp25 [Schizosaccharomyces pombe]|uniref:U3 small nucleolar RNA-associated protein 25 n=1 Tax=Schizosaccharomyces pombe (strain 972 / ATCC 24843) TaxID=284812 RepID=UTP25_SCHPO|nr:putative U3 associated protein Utp25 [Schizosaccharomyces pombe]O74974.1 RecName: Full=U3 small nucleolar RNA-associated protein 25; Short=U3 snoRNA-associated protein 25; AltName: Full=U three protein 25 [Schizosaccharomyces pombe 972h-]CAA19309.1 U3 associated protein Utp25 (predicted) [Schizosaccharomyces pombe]|eukprot:NP_588547.1 putative U3 associated protein Utp25 [Schizosaccharomyces pombe]
MAIESDLDGASMDELAGKSYEALLYLMNKNKKRKPEKKDDKEKSSKKVQKKNKVIESLNEMEVEMEDENENENDEQEAIQYYINVESQDADETLHQEAQDSSEDPFHQHFDYDDSEVIKNSIAAYDEGKLCKSIEESKLGVSQSFFPDVTKRLPCSCLSEIKNIDDLGLKQRILDSYKKQKPSGQLTSMQIELAKAMFNYQDVFFTNMSMKSHKLGTSLLALHALNHVFKTRDRVLKNSARISQNPELEFRDQGYTRPKVLILLPTRNSAFEFINLLISYSGTNQVENRKRFDNEFSIEKEVISEKKPEDFRYLFSGNTDDMFRLGVKFTRKTVKLFSQFYNSDIIVASPLGLRLAIGNKGDKKRDLDYLSSIEIAMVDQAHALVMQNWEHIECIFDELNGLPKEAHGCDFSRVRPWYLDQQARYMRQTILFSQYNNLDINSFFSHYMSNIAGKVKFRSLLHGVLNRLGYKVTQTFVRISVDSIIKVPDARFSYFTGSILVQLKKYSQSGILVYIPSYFDFVRVRNYMDEEGINYSAISEYSSVSDMTRARNLFYQGRTNIMLYTERAHHFRRFDFRGVKAVVMYGPPTNPQFYVELVRMPMRTISEGNLDSDAAKCRIMYTKFDSICLEGIVGYQRVSNMCHGKHEVFEFL